MMIADFMVRALVAGLGIALVAGPLGCFIVWRRMAYFGSAMAHAALMGVALGFLLGVSIVLGVVVAGVVMAVLLVGLQRLPLLATDTLLGIMAHAALALGLVALGLMEWLRIDLMGYLFGDILAVTMADIYWVYGGGAAVLLVLAAIWRPLLAITLHQDMAAAEGVPVLWVRLVFMLLIALVIAISMKIVGILLVTSLLIIPAAAARQLSRTPEQMAAAAALIGVMSVAAGLFASLGWDTPSGPSIVLAATLFFALSLLFGAAGPLARRR